MVCSRWSMTIGNQWSSTPVYRYNKVVTKGGGHRDSRVQNRNAAFPVGSEGEPSHTELCQQQQWNVEDDHTPHSFSLNFSYSLSSEKPQRFGEDTVGFKKPQLLSTLTHSKTANSKLLTAQNNNVNTWKRDVGLGWMDLWVWWSFFFFSKTAGRFIEENTKIVRHMP